MYALLACAYGNTPCQPGPIYLPDTRFWRWAVGFYFALLDRLAALGHCDSISSILTFQPEPIHGHYIQTQLLHFHRHPGSAIGHIVVLQLVCADAAEAVQRTECMDIVSAAIGADIDVLDFHSGILLLYFYLMWLTAGRPSLGYKKRSISVWIYFNFL